jgi:hypothetical protein
MKYTVEIDHMTLIYVLSFIQLGSGIKVIT